MYYSSEKIVTLKNADSAYGIQFPDLPSVFSASDEAVDIVKNAIEAIQFYAEDETLTEASNHADIVARDDVCTELNAGAYLISVPHIENDGAVVRVNVTF